MCIPKGTLRNSYLPYSVVNAVCFLTSSATVMLKYPECRSNMENNLVLLNLENCVNSYERKGPIDQLAHDFSEIYYHAE